MVYKPHPLKLFIVASNDWYLDREIHPWVKSTISEWSFFVFTHADDRNTQWRVTTRQFWISRFRSLQHKQSILRNSLEQGGPKSQWERRLLCKVAVDSSKARSGSLSDTMNWLRYCVMWIRFRATMSSRLLMSSSHHRTQGIARIVCYGTEYM